MLSLPIGVLFIAIIHVLLISVFGFVRRNLYIVNPDKMTMEILHETNDLTDELHRLMEDPRVQSDSNDLKIKYEYKGERGAINVSRPPEYNYLQEYFERRFKLQLNIYYTTSSKELTIHIRSQPDLDQVIELHDRNSNNGRLKLILAKKHDQN